MQSKTMSTLLWYNLIDGEIIGGYIIWRKLIVLSSCINLHKKLYL